MVDARKTAEVIADDLEGVTERESRVILFTMWVERIVEMVKKEQSDANRR